MDRAISRVFLVGAVLMIALMANLAWILRTTIRKLE